MKISIFENKKILFYGPANTKDKKTINISLKTNVIIYRTQEKINSIYKKMENYMNSPLKIGKNPNK